MHFLWVIRPNAFLAQSSQHSHFVEACYCLVAARQNALQIQELLPVRSLLNLVLLMRKWESSSIILRICHWIHSPIFFFRVSPSCLDDCWLWLTLPFLIGRSQATHTVIFADSGLVLPSRVWAGIDIWSCFDRADLVASTILSLTSFFLMHWAGGAF